MLYKIYYWFQKSIVNKFTVLLILSTLVPNIILGVIIYKTTEKIIYNNTFQTIQKNLKLLALNLEAAYFSVVALSNNYYNSKELQYYLQNNYDSSVDSVDSVDIVQKFNDNFKVTRELILPNSSVLKYMNYTFIFTKSNQIYTDFDFSSVSLSKEEVHNYIFQQYLSQLNNNSYSLVWLNTDKKLISNKPMLTFARYLRDRYGNPLGIIVIFIDEAMISMLYKEYGFEDEVMIINPEGQIVSHVRKENIGKNMTELLKEDSIVINKYAISRINGEEMLISTISIFNDDWKIISCTPTKKLFQKMGYISNSIVLTIFVIVIITFLVGKLIIYKISNPLKDLTNRAIEVGKGNLNVKINTKGIDEIGELGKCFERMLSQIRRLIQDIYNEQEMKIQSEIKAYQAQLNPHFLHNTLNDIKWIAISKKNYEIAEMIASLGTILESTIRIKSGMLKVQEEIELLKKYIYLQKFRYRDRFDVNFHVEDRILGYLIPNLLLQPLIENAIFHGIGKNKFIQIDVYGEQKEQELIFRVLDDGCGIPKEKISTLFESDKNNLNIGLPNIKRRIQLKFGSQYDVKVYSELGKGTEVVINLPIIKEDGKC